MGFFSKDKREDKKEEKPTSKMASLADDERLESGQLKLRVIIELLGQPKDLVGKTFDMIMTKLKSDKAYHLIKEERADFKRQGKLWSTFTEAELWTRDFTALAAFLFEYLPSSVEILEPQNYVVKGSDFTDFLNDLQTRLHESDMKVKNLSAEVQVLRKQGGRMLFNLIALALKSGSLKSDELANKIGTEHKDLKPYLKQLTEQGKLTKEGDTYSLSKK